MSTITVQRPIKVHQPRAAAWAADLFNLLLNGLQSLRAARARRRKITDRAAEAAAVRRYARDYAGHDPRFAAELMAAADRHEQGGVAE